MLNSEKRTDKVNRNDHEDIFNNSDDSDSFTERDVSTFSLTVGHIEDILVDRSFQQMQVDFFDKYWHLFEDNEENKLVYMPIFNEYVTTMETFIENYLKTVSPGFDLEDFLEQISERKNSLDGEVFEMLFSLSDFLIFKELMLDYKAAKEGKIADYSDDLLVTAIQIKEETDDSYKDEKACAFVKIDPTNEKPVFRATNEKTFSFRIQGSHWWGPFQLCEIYWLDPQKHYLFLPCMSNLSLLLSVILHKMISVSEIFN